MSSNALRPSDFRRRRRLQDARRQQTLGQVVEPGEVTAPPAGDDTPPQEQFFERDLAVIPVPPRTLRPDPLLEVGGGERAVTADALEDVLDERRTIAAESGHGLPVVRLLHSPAIQRVVCARHDGRHVGPVLEQLTGFERVGQQVARMRPESGEEGQLLTAHEHVDGVDLDDADAIEHLPHVAAVDPSGRARVGEALRGDGHSPRLVGRQRDGLAARFARSCGQWRPADAEVLDRLEQPTGVVVGDVHRQRQVAAWSEVEAGLEQVVEEQLAPPGIGVVEVGRRPDGCRARDEWPSASPIRSP